MSEQTNTPYYISIICGDVPMMIGKTGQYVRKFKNALAFAKKIDALEYVDRHGYNRIATVNLFTDYEQEAKERKAEDEMLKKERVLQETAINLKK